MLAITHYKPSFALPNTRTLRVADSALGAIDFPLAGKLYLNTLKGFDAVEGEQRAFLECMTDPEILSVVNAWADFVPVPKGMLQFEPYLTFEQCGVCYGDANCGDGQVCESGVCQLSGP